MSSDRDDENETSTPIVESDAPSATKGTDISKLAEKLKLGEGNDTPLNALERSELKLAEELASRVALDPLRDYRDVISRMDALKRSAGELSSLGRLSKQIAEQSRAIDSAREFARQDALHRSITESMAVPTPPRLPEIKIPENPQYEANRRLRSIEDRFEQIHELANDAATIATGLQASAAEFLHQFEEAADKNNRAAKKAIWIGVIAVVSTVLTSIAHIIYSELRREPDVAAYLHASIDETRIELLGSNESQQAQIDGLRDAFISAERESAEILRDIRLLLEQNSGLNAEPSEDEE